MIKIYIILYSIVVFCILKINANIDNTTSLEFIPTDNLTLKNIDWLITCTSNPICMYSLSIDESLVKLINHHQNDIQNDNIPIWMIDIIKQANIAFEERYKNIDRKDAIMILSLLESQIFTPHIQGLRCKHPYEHATWINKKIVCVCAPRRDCSIGGSNKNKISSSTSISGDNNVLYMVLPSLQGDVVGKDSSSTLSIVFFSLTLIVTFIIFIKLLMADWSIVSTPRLILKSTTTTNRAL